MGRLSIQAEFLTPLWGGLPTILVYTQILSQHTRIEKIAIKDVKLRTFITWAMRNRGRGNGYAYCGACL